MTTLNTLKKIGVGIALSAGLAGLPAAAYASAATEISTAAEHAGLSAASNSLLLAHMHLHHTLNCLVGPGGRGFDAKAADPCKGMGNGAIPDTTNAHLKHKLGHVAYRARLALRSHSLETVQKDAARIEAELKRLE